MKPVVVGAAAASIVGWQIVHRTAPLVRAWTPSLLPRRMAGPLSVRDSGPVGGSPPRALVLLHGIGATGDYFGGLYDQAAVHSRVVIVDLLGFGESLDEDRSSFSVDDHVQAVDDVVSQLDLAGARITIAAHSMGSAVALTWAQRHADRVERVVLWGPPVYADEHAASQIRSEYGPMARVLMADSRWAEWACAANCRNRTVSGWAMAALAPHWPTEVSRQASRHTWEAYRGSMASLVLEFDWTTVLPTLAPLTIFRGDDDQIGDRGYLDGLVADAEIVDVAGADHHVAILRPDLLLDRLA